MRIICDGDWRWDGCCGVGWLGDDAVLAELPFREAFGDCHGAGGTLTGPRELSCETKSGSKASLRMPGESHQEKVSKAAS